MYTGTEERMRNSGNHTLHSLWELSGQRKKLWSI